MGILTIDIQCHQIAHIISMRKVKASHNSAQVQHLYILLLKRPVLSEVQRYVQDSLLKHQLTRDNTELCLDKIMWQ